MIICQKIFLNIIKPKRKKLKKADSKLQVLKKFSEFIEKQIQDINQKDEIVAISNIIMIYILEKMQSFLDFDYRSI